MWMLCALLCHYGRYFTTTDLSYGTDVAKHETMFIENRVHKICQIFQALFIEAFTFLEYVVQRRVI